MGSPTLLSLIPITMYRAEVIKEKFLNLLGWRHHHSPVEYTIKDELTKSETGQYYQDIHPLLTLDNIRSIAPDFVAENFDELFSDWLKIKTQASILKAVESFYSEKLADKTINNLLESKVLFDGAGRMTDVVIPTNSLAGFELIPIRAEGVTLKIEKIGLQFNKNGKFTLYVFHSSNPEPIKTIEVEYTKNGGFGK